MASTNCYWKQKVEWNQQSRLNKETTQQFQWISCETLVQTLFWVRISSNDTRCYFCVLWVREALSCDNSSSWSSSSCCGKRWSSLFVWTCEAYLQTGRLPFLYCIYCKDDLAFIKSEVERLLSEGVMEPSRSPWGLEFWRSKINRNVDCGSTTFRQSIGLLFKCLSSSSYRKHCEESWKQHVLQLPWPSLCLPSNTSPSGWKSIYCFWGFRAPLSMQKIAVRRHEQRVSFSKSNGQLHRTTPAEES